MPRLVPLPLLLLAIVPGACTRSTTPVDTDSDTDTDDTDVVIPDPVPVSIRFRATFGADPARCDVAVDGVGTTTARVRLADFRAYAHDVAVIDSSGALVPVTLDPAPGFVDGGNALLDFATDVGACTDDAATFTTLTGTARADAITGVAFTLGLPRAASALPLDGATPPLDRASMFLNTTTGRFHTRAAVAVEGATVPWIARIHAVGCATGADCTEQALLPVQLPGVDPAEQEVVFDLKQLLSRNDVTADVGPSAEPGCSGLPTDADCRTLYVAYGLSAIGQDWIRGE